MCSAQSRPLGPPHKTPNSSPLCKQAPRPSMLSDTQSLWMPIIDQIRSVLNLLRDSEISHEVIYSEVADHLDHPHQPQRWPLDAAPTCIFKQLIFITHSTFQLSRSLTMNGTWSGSKPEYVHKQLYHHCSSVCVHLMCHRPTHEAF